MHFLVLGDKVMEHPAAIIFLDSAEKLAITLFYCQEHQIDVLDVEVAGFECLVLYDASDVPLVIGFILHHFGIIPFYMVG